MEKNKLNASTKIKELMADYPWLLDEAIKMDERFKMVNTPLGKRLIKNASIADLAKYGKINVEDVVNEIEKMIANHEKANDYEDVELKLEESEEE